VIFLKNEECKRGLSYGYLGKYSTMYMKITENGSKKLTVYLSEVKLDITFLPTLHQRSTTSTLYTPQQRALVHFQVLLKGVM